MTDIDDIISRVRELDAAATKGPWRAMRDGNSLVGNRLVGQSRIDEVSRPHNPLYCGGPRPTVTVMCDADADLVAYYRTACPQLAAEVERLAALFQQTHGVHHGWVAECERLRRESEWARNMLQEAEDALLEAQTERDALQDKLNVYEPPPRPRKYV